MRRWHADLLGRFAYRGSPWARRRLLAAGERADQAAIDTLWLFWYSRRDAATWGALMRWRRPQSVYSAVNFSRVALGEGADERYVVWLAQRFGHPIYDLARRYLAEVAQPDAVRDFCREIVSAQPEMDQRLVDFCVQHDVAPDDRIERAGFLLLTRQWKGYAEVDPDGRLAAEAYPVYPVRSRIRQRLFEAGDLRRVQRLLDESSAWHLNAHEEEIAEVARGYAAKAAWPQLWRLLLSRRVDELLTHLGSFPANWRPKKAAERTLFDRLRALPDAGPLIPLDFIEIDLGPADWIHVARRELPRATAADLRVVEDALADPQLAEPARAWLEPLALCLRFRFTSRAGGSAARGVHDR